MNEIDGIVILNDGRVADFRFYLYGETNATGMNGEITNLKYLPKHLVDLLRMKDLIKEQIKSKIFTQEELEAAYKQMEFERTEDAKKAERMLCWLCEEMKVERKNVTLIGGNGWGNISPYSHPYDFIFIHQTYGPYLEDFTKVLNGLSFVKKIDSFSKSPIYEATTPEGVYKIGFEYFDNHCTGY